MGTWFEVLAAVLAGALLVFSSIALYVGLVGGLFGERCERCRRCGHLGMTVDGQVHTDGCSAGLRDHARHLARVSLHGAHLRHH